MTADGVLRRVDATHEPELFWGLRGGGRGTLGIVVALEIDLHPVTWLHGGGLWFTGTDVPAMLHAYATWTPTVPEQMGSSVLLIRMPDLLGVPGPLRGRHVGHVRIAFTGPAAEGERLVRPLRALGPLLDRLKRAVDPADVDFAAELLGAGVGRVTGIDPHFGPERVRPELAGRLAVPERFIAGRVELGTAALVCRHTLEHIPALSEFGTELVTGMRRGGTPALLAEVPDLARILAEGAFWDLQYEHCSYFTPATMYGFLTGLGFVEVRGTLDELGLGTTELLTV